MSVLGLVRNAYQRKGNLKWAGNVRWKGQPEFNAKDLQPWYSDGKPAGKFKEVHIEVAASKKTRFTFLTVADAGHMVRNTISLHIFKLTNSKVPQDKPGPALDMMTRWIQGRGYE